METLEKSQNATISQHEYDFALGEQEIPTVVEASELEVDQLLQKQASSLVGSIAVNHAVIVEEVQSSDQTPRMSLYEASKRAAEGNAEAHRMLTVNAQIDYLERSYKTGFYCPPIELEKQADGSLTQNGQSLEEIHTNSIVYIDNSKIKERAKTVELLNSIRDQHYSKEGLLKNNARLIISPVHDGMDDAEAIEAGFFMPTRSLAFQLLTEHEGKTIIQVAFVTTKDLQSGVYDKASIVNFARKFGKDYEGLSSEEIIGRPLLIDKKLLPNLIVTVTEIFDNSASEVTGVKRFLGEATESQKTTKDYAKKFEECQSISKNMQRDIDYVVSKLIVSRPKSPTEATQNLAQFNDELLKKRIIRDKTIDARVLGTEAAYLVNHARHFIGSGQHLHQDLLGLQQRIEKVGMSSSCPGGSSNNTRKGNDNLFDLSLESDDNQNDTEDSVPEDCEFISEECPFCGDKKVRTVCKGGKYYGDCGCSS